MKRFAALACLLLLAVPALAEPLDVDDAIRLALAQNPRYRAARERALSASDSAKSTRGLLGPQIRLTDEYQHFDKPFELDASALIPSAMASPAGKMVIRAREIDTNTFVATIDQPILGLVHLAHSYASDRALAHAAEEGLKANDAALRHAVRTGFLRYFEAQALEKIAIASEAELSEQLTVTEARLHAGVLTNADLLRVKVARANARQQQIVAHSQAAVFRAQVLALVGLSPEASDRELIEPETLIEASGHPLDVAPSLAGALSQRAEVRQARYGLKAAIAERRARYARLLPDLDLEGAYLRVDGQLFLPPDSFYVGLRASWPIWQWGATYFAARSASARANASAFDLEAQRSDVAVELKSRLAESEAASSAVDVATQAIESATEAYRVTRALVSAGSATTTDLLDAESALTTARLNLTRARYGRALARVGLDRALGR